MRVLHVIPSISRFDGGPSNAIWQMVDSLEAASKENTFDTTVVTTNYEQNGKRFERGALASELRKASLICLPLTFEPYKISLRAMFWLLRNIRTFDVVHTHAMFSFLPIFAALVARVGRVPYIMRPLGTLNAYGLSHRRPFAKRISVALLERPLLMHAFAVHCTSEAEVLDVRAVCPQASVSVIPLAVSDFEAAPELAIRKLLGERVAIPVVLYLSRLDPKKNVEVVLQSASTLAKSGKRFTLLMAGDGDADYVQSLHSLATQLGIDEHVIWAGRIDGEKKTAAFSTASVFVLSSHNENFGIAVAEALAAGVPCVVSPGVAISAEVQAFGAGYVVAPQGDAFAEAISTLLDDDALRARASAAAKKLATEQFSYSAMGERLEALYLAASKKV
jgi:glycosyltransferase involved in cell wall biosynthesis